MNSITKNIFIIFIFLSLVTGNAGAAVTVSAQVDTSKDIYVGENFGYYIIVEGADEPGQVDIKPLLKFNPRSMGNRRQSSTTIVNGKVDTSATIVTTYLMVVNETGTVQIPSTKVTIDGKTYNTNAVTVNILKPGTTDLLEVEATLSERQCYVGQPVLMTIKLYIFADIGDFQFNIPAFADERFYLEEPDAANPQAREYDLGNGVTVRVNRYRTTRNGRDSILISFSKILIPKQAGTINIEPVTVSADIAAGRKRTRDSLFDDFFSSNIQYKRFMVGSEPATLEVLNLPDQGKPDGFYGLVGNYTISASATPKKVNVGDPITLTIKVGGGRYLKPVQWPALEEVPELADNFKIPAEKASPTIEDGYKIFTQTIRANNDKITAIPSIPLTYFDAEKGEYEAAKTEPIELDVSPSKILTNADLEGMDFTPVNKEVEAIKKGLSANYESLDALENQTFSPTAALAQPFYLIIWSGPLALMILSAVVKLSTNTTPEKTARKRRRSAANKAIGQLKQISCSTDGQHEQLASIVKQYIGERFDRSAGALTSNDCYEIIVEATKDTESADRYKNIIADCEAAQYSPAQGNIDNGQIEQVIELIRDTDKKSRK